ncbi:type VI secretion system ATPase TssH [Anatilimnocola aggregata]|uniref:type VI secretion system ATPase TssH n=1 Tax=Anatilimnocola aggregata TaxID=2528021 RepID=UPI0011A5C135|nr:type VI secretion system ATPase TssH [Anatilimnocola aggregata]
MAHNLKSLLGKLNEYCHRALLSGAAVAASKSNFEVELEHWFFQLLEAPNTDISRLLRHFEIDQSRLVGELAKAIEKFKTGNPRAVAGFSIKIVDLLREAWLIASVEFGANKIRSGHLLQAVLATPDLATLILSSLPKLGTIDVAQLQKDMRDVVSGSIEDVASAKDAATSGGDGGPQLASGGKTPALDQFTIDLTARAREGKVDPVLGRDFEIRQLVDILMRRRQNNPILTGEAGVGKTAVVEGFAIRIASGDVPPILQNVSLRSLDLGLLQAGAGVKGEFENRLKQVIAEVKASPQPIILFIDEAHTLIGAGGAAGQGDAANMLKPALARGELRTIAATTWSEYKKYFEKDAALARRFQVVKVEEPGEEQAINMMRGFTPTLEDHHGLQVLDEAIRDAVKLSSRYITGRQLPDKSVSLLDTAAARVAISHNATPGQVEDTRRRTEQLVRQIEGISREHAIGGGHDEHLQQLKEELTQTEAKLKLLDERWQKELELVKAIREIRSKIAAAVLPPKPSKSKDAKGNGQAPAAATAPAVASATTGPAAKVTVGGAVGPQAAVVAETAAATPPTAEELAQLRKDLDTKNAELKALQGENPLMQVCVDSQTIAEVVSGWTGIPIGKMFTDEIKTVLKLKEKLEERVIGQSHALDALGQRIRTARAGLVDPNRPIGVFMMVGPSGVGKTETAMALADILYGGDKNMVIINMSEYQEAHTVSSLKGSPPGYVGYGEGGVLTEAVRRKPYSVVLLDEVEKAHNDVMELFYQVFDKGMLEDAEGREIDFKNTVILLTSNVGTDAIAKMCADPETRPDPTALAEALRPELLKVFKPAFLGRMVVCPYYPLADDVMRDIIKLKLGHIGKRLAENHKAKFTYDDSVVEAVRERCREVESGARNVDHILTGSMLPEISREVLARMAEGTSIKRVHIKIDDKSQFAYELE